VVGTGVQARTHLSVLPHGHAFREIRVAGRTPAKVSALAEEAGATACESIAEAVRGADVVALCTNASEPVIQRRWLAPGAHVNSIGYSESGGELDEATLRDGRLVVESRVAFEPPPAGATELQGMEPSAALELGEILSGNRRGRTSAEQVTVYKSMGHAAEDAAAAGLALERAREIGAGASVEL
jgi:ornithine cyclodeaminase/alanine dehydrogenase-like protein (mu-crystallin family)